MNSQVNLLQSSKFSSWNITKNMLFLCLLYKNNVLYANLKVDIFTIRRRVDLHDNNVLKTEKQKRLKSCIMHSRPVVGDVIL